MNTQTLSERLRQFAQHDMHQERENVMREAADRIEADAARIAELEAMMRDLVNNCQSAIKTLDGILGSPK